MSKLLYITFHGGGGGIRNIDAWDKDGGKTPTITDMLETGSIGHDLDELRGFFVAGDGSLYLTNAYKSSGSSGSIDESIGEILHFAAPGSSGTRAYMGPFCAWSQQGNPGLQHPFDVVQDPDGNVYVANQGQKANPDSSNAVTYYYAPGSSQAGQPMPAKNPIYPGAFIPPEQSDSHGVKVLRDAIFGPSKDSHHVLYLADEERNEVRRYDKSGKYLDSPVTAADGLDKPVHLLVSRSKKHLYIGSQSNNSVLALEIATGKTTTLVDSSSGIDSTAGLAEDGDGWLYVASRMGKEVLRFDHSSGKPDKKPFIHDLNDNPEFLLWV
jgi:hypothetical protein